MQVGGRRISVLILCKPFCKPWGAPLEANVAAQTNAWDSFVCGSSAASLVSNPRLGNPPPGREFDGIDQFDAVPGRTGHQWDSRSFRPHIFNHVDLYIGSRNHSSNQTGVLKIHRPVETVRSLHLACYDQPSSTSDQRFQPRNRCVLFWPCDVPSTDLGIALFDDFDDFF